MEPVKVRYIKLNESGLKKNHIFTGHNKIRPLSKTKTKFVKCALVVSHPRWLGLDFFLSSNMFFYIALFLISKICIR